MVNRRLAEGSLDGGLELFFERLVPLATAKGVNHLNLGSCFELLAVVLDGRLDNSLDARRLANTTADAGVDKVEPLMHTDECVGTAL